MLLLADSHRAARRAAAQGPLKPLADSLAADLEPVLVSDPYVPREKALLSRAGGRCERDATMLEFDPFSPHEHRCPVCGTVYRGALHYRWWIYWYQLWLAERAVHGAALWLLCGDPRHQQFARDVLLRYADQYLQYPNVDNVLGPTRVFFSTYLESIWLLQICAATDLLEAGGDHTIGAVIRDRIVEPSAQLIAGYDEGFSNRQVWNNAALMASSLMLGDRNRAEQIARGPTGLDASLARGLLADGTWFEGENYHLFAHRGLWYGMTLAETAGIPVDAALTSRFNEGFSTPFATALPDFTFPSRKDSQYAVSLRQSRFAEQCELGLARTNDRRLIGALARIYAGDIPRRDTGRSRSSADVERNVPASALTRADLNWRALLHARVQLPPLEPAAPRSVHLEDQGFTVFRRAEGSVYVALDWGQSGGGHGHPDRLNVLFSHGNSRWLDDLGTGSYVDRSLHWYRSTLAHNAPMVNGHAQQLTDGAVLAYDERGGFGWILSTANIAPGVAVQRALVVTPDYFIDELRWTASEPVRFELPIHFDGRLMGPPLTPATLDGGNGLEDGFEFVSDVSAASIPAATPFALAGRGEGDVVRARICVDTDARIFRGVAPGQPATASRPFYVVRAHGTGGTIRSVWTWSSRETGVSFDRDHIVVQLGGERHEHWLAPQYWQVELSVGGAHSGIELFGWRPPAAAAPTGPAADTGDRVVIRRHETRSWNLGEAHYRPSEVAWTDAGRPSARVSVTAQGSDLIVDIAATTGEVVFVDPRAVNSYDNEHPDINGHGVQVYVHTQNDGGAWIVTPAKDQRAAHIRPLAGWGSLALTHADWTPTAAGFTMQLHVALPPGAAAHDFPIALDVLINETVRGRDRRRGQLVMSGAENEFVYLRGDRHDQGRLIPLLLSAE